MLQTSDNVCLGYFLHVLLVLPILSPERKGNFILFSNAQDCKCYYWDFLFSAPFQYILASAKCIKYEQQRADFCHIKHSVLFYAFCISRVSLQILISYFLPTKIMFFHLAFSVFLQPILHLNGLVDLNFKKALTATVGKSELKRRHFWSTFSFKSKLRDF